MTGTVKSVAGCVGVATANEDKLEKSKQRL